MNDLIVILDDLGNELLPWSPWPNVRRRRPQMPFLAALAAKGTLYPRFYTEPACSPTRASLLTCSKPYTHGVGNAILPDEYWGMDPHLYTWIRDLPDHVYSALHGKWHLSQEPTDPLTVGFSRWSGSLRNLPDYLVPWDAWYADAAGVRSVRVKRHASQFVADEVISDLHSIGPAEFAIIAAFHCPHHPYHDVPKGLYHTLYRQGDEEGQLIAMCESIDIACAQMWSAMSSLQRANTRWWIWSDNGTAKAYNIAPQGQGKGSTGEGGINTALAVYGGPSSQGPGLMALHSTEPFISVTDIGPTILEGHGVDPPKGVYGRVIGANPRHLVCSQKIKPPPADGTPPQDTQRSAAAVGEWDGVVWKLHLTRFPASEKKEAQYDWARIDVPGVETAVTESDVPASVRAELEIEAEAG